MRMFLFGIVLFLGSLQGFSAHAETFDQLQSLFKSAPAIPAQGSFSNPGWADLLATKTVRCETVQVSRETFDKVIPPSTTQFSEEVRIVRKGLANFLLFQLSGTVTTRSEEEGETGTVDQFPIEYVLCAIDVIGSNDDEIVPFGPYRRAKGDFAKMEVSREGSFVFTKNKIFQVNQRVSEKNAFIIDCPMTHYLTLPDSLDLNVDPVRAQIVQYLEADRACFGNNRRAQIHALEVVTENNQRFIKGFVWANSYQSFQAPFIGEVVVYGGKVQDESDPARICGNGLIKTGWFKIPIVFQNDVWKLAPALETTADQARSGQQVLGSKAIGDLVGATLAVFKPSLSQNPSIVLRDLFNQFIAPFLSTKMTEPKAVSQELEHKEELL